MISISIAGAYTTKGFSVEPAWRKISYPRDELYASTYPVRLSMIIDEFGTFFFEKLQFRSLFLSRISCVTGEYVV